MSTLEGSYLSADDFFRASYLPTESAIELEARRPGFVDRSLQDRSAEIASRLIKRYAVPLDLTNPPLAIRRWLVALVTLDCYMALGFDPSTTQDQLIVSRAEDASAQIKEAADAKEGLFELPLRADLSAGGVTKGGPLAYSEQSPYDAKKLQRRGIFGLLFGGRRERY